MKKYFALFFAFMGLTQASFACEHKENPAKAPIFSGSSEEVEDQEVSSVETCEA